MDKRRDGIRKAAMVRVPVALFVAVLMIISGCSAMKSDMSEQSAAKADSRQTAENASEAGAENGSGSGKVKETVGSSEKEEQDVSGKEERDVSEAAESADSAGQEASEAAEAANGAGQKSGTQKEAGLNKGSAATAEKSVEEPLPVSPPWTISWNPEWEFADHSEIHDGKVTRYFAEEPRRNLVVAVNAGHGTKGGESVKTLCHPDGSPKVTGGSTGKGSVKAAAVTGGTTFLNGGTEAEANLQLAMLVKEELLSSGFDVLMIRESEDVQLDNIARTVFANNMADCHIALHYDSTGSDKGFYYIRVPDVSSYRNMEPVASHWEEHHALGEALLAGAKENDIKIYGEGSMAIDLTQTSYSTVPSVDVEVGDRASDHSEETQRKIAKGISAGIRHFADVQEKDAQEKDTREKDSQENGSKENGNP